LLAELDEAIVKYNINVLKFRDLSCFDDDYAPILAAAWDKVIKDKIKYLNCEEVDLAKLGVEVLNEEERRA